MVGILVESIPLPKSTNPRKKNVIDSKVCLHYFVLHAFEKQVTNVAKLGIIFAKGPRMFFLAFLGPK